MTSSKICSTKYILVYFENNVLRCIRNQKNHGWKLLQFLLGYSKFYYRLPGLHRYKAGSPSTVQDTTTPTRVNKTTAVVPTSASSTATVTEVRSMPRVVNDLEIVNFFSVNPAADALMFVNVAQQAGLVPPGTEATLLEQATRVKNIMHTFSSNLLIRQA